MGAKSGFALKLLQWFIRGIQLCCCAVALALFSYFLAVASRHNNIPMPTWTKAVEGIAGVGVIYTLIGLLLLCCLAGHPFTSFIAIILDIAFIGAFIYVAQANRGGASSCRGNVDTPFGNNRPAGDRLGNGLPSYRTICQMETAVLAVSIVAIVFFLLSAIVEFVLVRHRRKERRFGPSPNNNYTSGYGQGGFMGRFRRNKTGDSDGNTLPTHTHPDQVRPSYNTDSTAIAGNEPHLYSNKHGDTNGFDREGHVFNHDGQTAYPETGVAQNLSQPAGYRYGS
ncbi:Uu.00g089150.m01.CDS01 [Anthostomella pinea]|uniref:Uu.00g089150.m01.CDS01 n=1 Tax=Anthostomella pinea TaxID=933095 RepID=A0AAI8VMP4_9PEZI|nr:Uu.00g089150.m01.CDS01 [Anthostomella pinea]